MDDPKWVPTAFRVAALVGGRVRLDVEFEGGDITRVTMDPVGAEALARKLLAEAKVAKLVEHG